MAELLVRACDMCHGTPAEVWLLGEPGGGRWQVDLCVDCAQPLRELVLLGRVEGERPQRHRFKKTILLDDD